MRRLWDEEIDQKSSALRVSTLARLTRHRDIIDQYVRNVMQSLRPVERRLAAILFDRLVTPSGTKMAMALTDLQSLTGGRPQALETVITKLKPLLNDVAPPRGVEDRCYEISHDVLAPALSKWQVTYGQRRRLFQLGATATGFAILAAVAVGFWWSASTTVVRLHDEENRRRQAESEAAAAKIALGRSLAEAARVSPVPTPATPPPPDTPTVHDLGALSRKNLWPPGTTLRVRFLEGTPVLQARVQTILTEWTRYANISLAFGKDPAAEVRISFKSSDGSWAYVGKNALDIPRTEPTVNYGYVTAATSDGEATQYVLHEFGHVLGLIHEMNQPNANIPWNVAKVFATFGGPPNNWPREIIESNFFGRYRQGDFPPKPFDPKSIMMYAVPKDLTDGTFATGVNQVLSEGDKRFIATLYPSRGGS